MKVLNERQKGIATYNRKTGQFTKEMEKKLTSEMSRKKEESVKSGKSPYELEIIARKFMEKFKDSDLHQNEIGSAKDFEKLGRVLVNKEKIRLPVRISDYIAKKYLWGTDFRSFEKGIDREEIQSRGIFSQDDHGIHKVDKEKGVYEGGNESIYVELEVGGIMTGMIRGINSPDGILIKKEGGRYNVYFVELKSTDLYSSGNVLTPSGKYLVNFLTNNELKGLKRIGVTSGDKGQVENFKKRNKLPKSSLIMTNMEFSKFKEGSVTIRGNKKGEFNNLRNNKILDKVIKNFGEGNFENSVKRFVSFIQRLNRQSVVKEDVNYFDY